MAFFDSPISSGNSTHLMHQDSLLSQFLKLCLDNQQSTSSDRLNSFSSTSSSFGSYNFTDPISSPFNNLSPEFSSKLNACPEESETRSPFSLNFSLPQITYQTTGKRKSRRGSSAECAFCKNNGQPVSFYQSHVLKDRLGRVVCPILQAYNCPICNNGGGTQAHTVRYCPENKPTIKVKNSTSNRDKSDSFMQQDTLMAQFAKLYLNQQSTPITKLNSLSSSSSHDSCKVIDPIGTPFKRSNDDSNRLLKARPEGNLTSHHLSFNFTSTPVTNQKSAKRRSRRGSCMECVFCKNNGQPASFYQSHVLKDPLDRVVCPILSAYNCPICNNGGGPKAHTVRYCPENKPHARIRNALLKSATLLNSNQSIL